MNPARRRQLAIATSGLLLATIAITWWLGTSDPPAAIELDEVTAPDDQTDPSHVTALEVSPTHGLESIGAHVTETDVVTLQVEQSPPPQGADTAESARFGTIQEAVDEAHALRSQGQGVRILVAPGTYRESIVMRADEADAPPLILEASQLNQVIISGSDVWDDWSAAGEAGTYTHPWPFKWGGASEVDGVGGRREMVFIDGQLLTPVNAISEMIDQSFVVNEESQEIVVDAAGIDLTGAQVEVAIRGDLLTADGITNVVIRGFTFQHAASEFDTTAVSIVNAKNVVLSHNVITKNSWTGLGLGTSHQVTLDGNAVSYNGGGGIGAFEQAELRMVRNETSGNNWRGQIGDYVGWSIAGVKVVGGGPMLIRDHVSRDNATRGLWLDYDVSDVAVEESVFCGNLTDGVMLEALPGFVDMTSSTVCGNQRRGLVIVNAVDVSIRGSTICGNGESGIHLDAEPGGRTIETDEGPIDLPPVSGLQLRYNVIGGSPTLLRANLSNEDWQRGLDTLDSDDNTWLSASARSFRVPGLNGDLDGWVAHSGQDGSSVDDGEGAC